MGTIEILQAIAISQIIKQDEIFAAGILQLVQKINVGPQILGSGHTWGN